MENFRGGGEVRPTPRGPFRAGGGPAAAGRVGVRAGAGSARGAAALRVSKVCNGAVSIPQN